MIKSILATGTALAALCSVASAPAYAQGPDATPAADATGDAPSDIIVTGSTRAQRRFDVSYAINTVSQDDVEKIAPVAEEKPAGRQPRSANRSAQNAR